MEVSAKLKHARASVQKTRLVADQIRNCSISNAINILTYSSKSVAILIKKVLNSAVANAEHNKGADIDELYISTIHVDEGPKLKRLSPRAKGRSNRILKPTCHITIIVSDSKRK